MSDPREQLIKDYENVPRSDREFCRQCGASFPPIIGEGCCVEWHLCWEKQRNRRERLISVK